MREALADALSLAFPVDCAGCGQPGRALCAGCRRALAPEVHVRTLASGLRVWSGLEYGGVAARALRALKEDGRTAIVRDLAPALSGALAAAARDAGASGLVVVPIPASRAARRRRGFVVVELLARRAGVAVSRALSLTRRTADQRALDREGRRANASFSMRARGVAGCVVVVVDDVMTTGSTLDEAARALRAAGAEVVAAATVAATPLRGRAPVTRESPA